MIIGKSFAFAHIPKTGGDALLQYFKLLPDLLETWDDVDSPRKHEPFAARPGALEKPILLLCLRNHVAWALSMLHELQRQPTMLARHKLDGSRVFETDYLFDHVLPAVGPDVQLAPFLKGVDPAKLYWLRCEHLKSDFLKFVRTHLRDLTEEETDRIIDCLGAPKGRLQYTHGVDDVFDAAYIQRLQRENPLWCYVEGWVYSDQHGPAWKIPFRSDLVPSPLEGKSHA